MKRATVSGGPFATVKSVATTGYTDLGLTNGTAYYYVVTATNAVGESGISNQAAATPKAPAPPAIPTNVAAGAGNAQVTLTWTASVGAVSYHVKRSTTSGGPYVTVASPTTPSDTDGGLVNGTTYYYVVSAVNAAGESLNSVQASATPAVNPSGVTLVGITVNPSTVPSRSVTTATVTLSGTPPAGGVTVTLTVNKTFVLSFPSSITLTSSSLSFPVHTGGVTTPTPVILSASYGGVTASTTVTLTQ